MTDMLLQMKLDKLRKGEPLSSIKNITIDSLMLSFCRILGSDIENAKKVRQIIEYRFIKTKVLNIFNMVAMLMLILCPFIFQIFVDQVNTSQIHNALIVCLSGSVFFMIQELIQMKGQGWKYFLDVVNWVDILLHPLLLSYIFLRMGDDTLQVDPRKIPKTLSGNRILN